ncbi:anti-sigma factor [Lysobacter sp. Root690]|uniref:anti-sigma factor family protein n=1 Tax=Lysobacter sp. Root690 TaxID=1736588 RepID=UPI0006F9D75B|nr:anti-sigma factor [Lysobacter sp. Root690]KRB07614.1 hypothetical protein ASD86_07200 [Lysobacter sp. Root690]
MNIPSEHDLHAYVDGRLDAARRAEVEAWLARHPESAEELRAWQRDAQQLRAALAGDALSAQPELDPARLRRGLTRKRNARYAMAAAIVLSIGVGGLGGWQARVWSQSVDAPSLQAQARPLPMADAIAAHRLFAVRHDLRLDRTDGTGDLQTWLDANFRAPMRLPDLSAAGFRPSGVRMLSTEQGAAALVVYADPSGNAISFYIRPPGPQRHLLPRGDRRDGDLFAQYWSRGDYNYAMVSRGDSANVVRRALAGAI